MTVDAALLCGVQGSGKSTFCRERFFDTHVRISRDLLRTRHREARFLEVCLETRQRFVVDKVNATPEDRAPYVAAARAAGFAVSAWWFDVSPRDAIARNAGRTGAARVPVPAILGTHKRLVPPRLAEGFDVVWRVRAAGGEFLVELLVGSAPDDAPSGGVEPAAPRLFSDDAAAPGR
jgi:predicted kinase